MTLSATLDSRSQGQEQAPLLQVTDLVKHFPVGGGLLRKESPPVRAVDGVSFSLGRGETLGLVGESGSGKSTLGRLVLRLLDPTAGSVVFDGQDITTSRQSQVKPLRRRMQLIFQDPVSSFNPRMTIEELLLEPMVVHGIGTPTERKRRCVELLDQVGLASSALAKYPHQFSGGQAQRIGIARALTTDPELLVCDEAVSALDVSIQAQVLNLLKSIQQEQGISFLFIAHDLNVVRYISDRVCVMYLGKLAEVGGSDQIMAEPRHPYTQALIRSIPAVTASSSRVERIPLQGEIPNPSRPPAGCTFHTRCPLRFDACDQDVPTLHERDGSLVACHLYRPEASA
ncbi:ABC transporter ATP-binding protein [Ornithinimicrobium murale]|uniref:ABC transporter ATP-binding protein n=1 Tax=Ornithinimicrobium murale TaxID=1050153 RepID=UPI00192DA8EB|nr:oligopeptide/dipeptide ABC transporter ATP-binding protein [Ornithinimicrobium murale]